MSIVKLARARLTAFSSEKKSLLNLLQEMEEVHFEDLSTDLDPTAYQDILRMDKPGLDLHNSKEELASLKLAIKGLESQKPAPGMLAGLNNALPEISYREAMQKAATLNLEEESAAVRNNLRRIDQNKEELDLARQERRTMRPYGKLDATLEDLDNLRSVNYALGTIPKRSEDFFREALADTEESYLEVLDSDDRNLYFLLLYTDTEVSYIEETLRKFAFSACRYNPQLTGAELLAEIDERILRLEAENKDLKAALASYSAKSLEAMKLRAEYLLNQIVKEEAREKFIRGEHIFFLELYLPLERAAELKARLAEVLHEPYLFEMEAVERDDPAVERVPVLLKNGPLTKPFESVVTTFSTPKYNEIDPTPVVMPWFSACFALMLGDLGYALVIFLLTTLGVHLFNMKEGTRNTLRFFQIMSVPSMLVGLIYGSFFALDIPQFLPFVGILNPTKDTDAALTCSLIFGVIMLFFGLLVNGYMKVRDRDPLGLLSDVIAWFLIVIGAGILLFGEQVGLGTSLNKLAVGGMIVGAILVLLFSERHQASWAGRLGWGAYNVYGFTSWIGDIVSYARIAALAMSGGFIGYAVNLISGMIAVSIPGYIGAIIILLVFHPFNIFLSGLSAYVHTLRLIYVEFFGKFFEGGGIPFRRFRAESEYINIK